MISSVGLGLQGAALAAENRDFIREDGEGDPAGFHG